MENSEKYILKLFSKLMKDEYIVTDPIERLGGMNNNNYKIYTNKGSMY